MLNITLHVTIECYQQIIALNTNHEFLLYHIVRLYDMISFHIIIRITLCYVF